MDRKAGDSLSSRILALLAERGPLKAREIAELLEAPPAEVNRTLFGVLYGRVAQDRAYRWNVMRRGTGTGAAAPAGAAASPLARLARYYMDCLAQDAEQGCSAFAKGRRGEEEYAVLAELPEVRAGTTWSAPIGDAARALAQRSRQDSSTMLYIGYPVLLRYHRTANWEGFFVEPLLLYPLEAGEGGALQVADDLPTLNFKALRSLGDGGNVLDEIVSLSEDLGLVGTSEPPSIEDIALRLQAIRPDWPWIDLPLMADRKVDPPISAITAAGIYNYAVLVLGQRPNFTQGLESELRLLSTLPADQVRTTALGQWLRGSLDSAPTVQDDALVEVVGLNTEQRAAVRSALNQPLTVITGPPGTGKSQVVTALLANCAWRGQRVLFASKNNKAVDVVEQRVNGLARRPTLIRLGSRQYESRLAEFLMGLLSASTTPDDQADYQRALADHEHLSAELQQAERDAVRVAEARNAVDHLEADVEGWRAVFGDSLGPLGKLNVAELQQALESLQGPVAKADVRRVGLLERLFWPLLRSRRLNALNEAVAGGIVARAFHDLRLDIPEPVRDDAGVEPLAALLTTAGERLAGVVAIQRYLQALATLTAQPTLEEIAKKYTKTEESLGDNALELWQAWSRMQPGKLSRIDRQSLSRYLTVLSAVLDANRSGVPMPGTVWHQYRELVPKVAHLLPCWAVTSLSANNKVPFEPGMFDLLVVDEASQCDIASVLPLLYRAKRVAVIGDPKQLAHISKVSPRQDAQLQQKHGVAEEFGEWAYSVNSLFALASTRAASENFVLLRDHHRSHADIIEFSNRQFYEERLRVATAYDRLKRVDTSGPAVQWLHVDGSVRRPPSGSVQNDDEAAAVVRLLRRLLLDHGYQGTIGVVSPYRAQCTRIRELVNEDAMLAERLGRLQFIAETAHQFQGDERDVIVFSPVVAAGIAEGSLRFLRANGNLFNVAITRARAALYVVGDKKAARESGVDYLAAFAEYADELREQGLRQVGLESQALYGPEYPVVARPDRVSEWERVLYRALYAAGVRAIPQYSVEKYVLDFAVVEGERRLNIEVDGERYHRAWDGELIRRDRLRNQRMIELGWDVKRFWVYQIRDDIDRCVAEVRAWVDAAKAEVPVVQ